MHSGIELNEAEIIRQQEKQMAILAEYERAYMAKLEEDTQNLYLQFVTYISSAQVPLTQVLLVLEILRAQTIEQARERVGV